MMKTLRIDVEPALTTLCGQARARPAPRTGNTEVNYCVFFEGREIGVWRVPNCDAARWLLENNLANRDDELQMWRGDIHCMTGNVGWYADRTVRDGVAQGGTPRWMKWYPAPEGTFSSHGSQQEAP